MTRLAGPTTWLPSWTSLESEYWEPQHKTSIVLRSETAQVQLCFHGAACRLQDRSKFSSMCDELDIDQPQWSEFVQLEEQISVLNTRLSW